MKKIFLLLLISLFVITGCNGKMTKYEEISYDDYIEMIENKDTFILFVGSNECSHCALYKDKVNQFISEYQVMIYYIDVNKFTPEQLSEFKVQINFNSTPTTVFIEEGREKKDKSGNSIYRISGNLDYDKVVEKIKKAGFIED